MCGRWNEQGGTKCPQVLISPEEFIRALMRGLIQSASQRRDGVYPCALPHLEEPAHQVVRYRFS
jgi:hypothetical protein